MRSVQGKVKASAQAAKELIKKAPPAPPTGPRGAPRPPPAPAGPRGAPRAPAGPRGVLKAPRPPVPRAPVVPQKSLAEQLAEQS